MHLCKKLFTAQSRLLTTFYKETFENIVEKGENAGNQHFLLFQQCFLPVQKRISIFQPHLFYRLQRSSIWTSLKFCRLRERPCVLNTMYVSKTMYEVLV